MQRQEQDEIQKDGPVRMLNAGAVFVHNNHLQSGFRKASRCPVCSEGLDGAYSPIESSKPVDKPDGVPAGDGVDKAGDPPPARDFRDYTSEEADKLLGQG